MPLLLVEVYHSKVMFSRIGLFIYAACLVTFTANLIFGEGIRDFSQWFIGFAVGASFVKISDFILSIKPRQKKAVVK